MLSQIFEAALLTSERALMQGALPYTGITYRYTAVRGATKHKIKKFHAIIDRSPRTPTVVVPEHWFISAIGETLVPHRHLTSVVGNEHNKQLDARILGPVE